MIEAHAAICRMANMTMIIVSDTRMSRIYISMMLTAMDSGRGCDVASFCVQDL